MKLLIINGPNMNMLGIREPDVYGHGTYEELLRVISEERGPGNDLTFFQSNHEGAIVDEIQKAYYERYDGIVINPAAYTHTSIAIADAVRAVRIPTVEVHISDIDKREDYRKVSYLRDAVIGTVSGHGSGGYIEAIDMLKTYTG